MLPVILRADLLAICRKCSKVALDSSTKTTTQKWIFVHQSGRYDNSPESNSSAYTEVPDICSGRTNRCSTSSIRTTHGTGLWYRGPGDVSSTDESTLRGQRTRYQLGSRETQNPVPSDFVEAPIIGFENSRYNLSRGLPQIREIDSGSCETSQPERWKTNRLKTIVFYCT